MISCCLYVIAYILQHITFKKCWLGDPDSVVSNHSDHRMDNIPIINVYSPIYNVFHVYVFTVFTGILHFAYSYRIHKMISK